MTLDESVRKIVTAAVAEALADFQRPIPRKAYSVAEAAESLGRTHQFVRTLINSGELPARRAGVNGHLLIPDAALDAWLAGEGAQADSADTP